MVFGWVYFVVSPGSFGEKRHRKQSRLSRIVCGISNFGMRSEMCAPVPIIDLQWQHKTRKQQEIPKSFGSIFLSGYDRVKGL